MKDAFEKNIKESLENFEYEYNPKAWEQLNSKLDSAPKGGKSPLKWYIAASVTAGLLIGGYLYFNSNNETQNTTNDKLVAEQNTSTTTENDQSTHSTAHESDNPTFTAQPDHTTVEQQRPQDVEEHTYQAPITEPTPGTSSTDGSQGTGYRPADYTEIHSSNDKDNKPAVTSPGASTEIQFVDPQIGPICQGIAVQVVNDNDFNLIIEFPNGQMWTGKAKSTSKLYPSVAGTYHVGYYSHESFVQSNTFEVKKAPTANFEFIETDKPFENGLPTVKVVTESIADQLSWSTDFESIKGNKAEFHFFKDGKHDITLTTTGSNGCKTSVKKSVSIENNYNLLAENVFVPTDLDPKNNVFMPDALVDRNTGFQMIILDPRDGHVVFETNDASIGWEGNDKQTGKMADYQKAYIWKVTLNNPMPGENPVYSGTITPLERRH